MNQQEIIQMAREAGFQTGVIHDKDGNDSYLIAKFEGGNCLHALQMFANIVASKEREECAKLAATTVCDTHIPTGVNIYGTRAAAAIRARTTDITTE